MTSQLNRKLKEIEKLMGMDDGQPKIRVTLRFVEMADGHRTGRVTCVPYIGFEKTGFAHAYTVDGETDEDER